MIMWPKHLNTPHFVLSLTMKHHNSASACHSTISGDPWDRFLLAIVPSLWTPMKTPVMLDQTHSILLDLLVKLSPHRHHASKENQHSPNPKKLQHRLSLPLNNWRWMEINLLQYEFYNYNTRGIKNQVQSKKIPSGISCNPEDKSNQNPYSGQIFQNPHFQKWNTKPTTEIYIQFNQIDDQKNTNLGFEKWVRIEIAFK